MIKALILDFDGLILDTEGPEYRSWREIYQRHGCDLSISEWAICIGTSSSGFDPVDNLETELGRVIDRDRIRAEQHVRNQELLDRERVLPGVRDYLDAAKRLNLGIGLASSSHRNWVEPHLSRLGLLPYFDAIKTHDDVALSKPDPSLYNQALDALGVAPSEAIAFEDSPNGALAAKRAGVYCVVVPNEITVQLSIEADSSLSSLADLPLENLIAQIESGFNDR